MGGLRQSTNDIITRKLASRDLIFSKVEPEAAPSLFINRWLGALG
jgi:hypothetical protein